ncbi:MAG: AP2 domain-containing protein [Rubricoccaceae bacterium]|nr:AP2 domain-containing protein [Rubricoccaceae bacterium]
MDRKHHHITRIDIEPSEKYPKRHPTHGWQVRVRRDGKRLSKFFADARHGDREGALEAAILYRDALLDELPAPDARPRKAWSNTGVVGLSVREKKEAKRDGAAGGKSYVQINWVDADGKRHGASFSVDKWGLRRALWNGCLRLHREREAAGRPVEEPHVMFARAQEPFMDQIEAEIAAEQAAEGTAPPDPAPSLGGAAASAPTNGRTTPRPLTPDEELKHEEKALEHLANTLFGR